MQVFRTLEQVELSGETAVALGAFDGLHLGHYAVISRAVESGCTPVVFTFQDNPAEVLSGKCRYLTTEEERLRLLESWGVQAVVMPRFSAVSGNTPQAFLSFLRQTLHAKVLCCGEDFRFGKDAAGTVEQLCAFCAANHMTAQVVPPVQVLGQTVSATRIRNTLEQGDVKTAEQLLGRPFGYCLPVVHGNHLGQTIGTPTMNQHFPPSFILPRFGVYASAVDINGTRYCGVTNVGVKPTVGSDRALSETWVLDFSGDLYGRTLRVELLDFIRDERRFRDLQELKTVIFQNAETARAIFRQKYA